MKPMNRILLSILAVTVVLAGGGAYYLATRVPFDQQKPAVGDIAPEISLADLSGRMLTLSDLRGRVVLLNFWASWCPPCTAELRDFQTMLLRHEEKDFAVIAIATDDISPDVVHEMGLTFPIAKQNERVARAYGDISHVPVSFLIDRAGIIVKKTNQVYAGKDLAADLEQLIRRAP